MATNKENVRQEALTRQATIVPLAHVLGKPFVHSLLDTVFALGSLRVSKADMITLMRCGNFAAARKLNKVLKRLGIRSVHALWNTNPMRLLDQKGIGPAAMWVAMTLLDASGYDASDWWTPKNSVMTIKARLAPHPRRRHA